METGVPKLRIGLVCDDLLMGSRVREALRNTPCELVPLGSSDALERHLRDRLDLVLVSMNLRRMSPEEAIQECVRVNVRCVAFAGHSETALHDAALAAGAWKTVANSGIAMALPLWLSRWGADEAEARC